MMKIYVATSWKNWRHKQIVKALIDKGYHVYDFKANGGFHWSHVDPLYKTTEYSAKEFNNILNHPLAVRGYNRDMDALNESDICVLVLPCGRSSHLELGYAIGARKYSIIYFPPGEPPDLMYGMVDKIVGTLPELIKAVKDYEGRHIRKG